MGTTPQRIFKYVAPERIDIIEKLRIRFTPPSCFNDPFEARFCIDGLQNDQVMGWYMEIADRRHYRTHVLHQNSAGYQPMTFEDFRRQEAARCLPAMEQLKSHPCEVKRRVAGRTQKFWDTVGILSLTATENNLLMWAHYGNSHEGMLIEFNAAHRFFRPPTKPTEIDLGTLVRVEYSNKRPRGTPLLR
jgi:hypothetical protein